MLHPGQLVYPFCLNDYDWYWTNEYSMHGKKKKKKRFLEPENAFQIIAFGN